MENNNHEKSTWIILSESEKAAVKLSLIKRETAKKFTAAKTWPSNERKARAIVGARKAPTTKKKAREKSTKELAASLGGNYDNLKIVNNFCLKAAYDQAAKIPLKKIDNKSIVNPQIAALDGISAAWINWNCGKMPDSLATAADIKTVRAFFKSACRYESMHHFRDVATNGLCHAAISMADTKKARGLRSDYIRTVFESHLKGDEKSLAISFFCDGLKQSDIAKNFDCNQSSVSRRIKRLTKKITSPGSALFDSLGQFVDESVALKSSLSIDALHSVLDNHAARMNYDYSDSSDNYNFTKKLSAKSAARAPLNNCNQIIDEYLLRRKSADKNSQAGYLQAAYIWSRRQDFLRLKEFKEFKELQRLKANMRRNKAQKTA